MAYRLNVLQCSVGQHDPMHHNVINLVTDRPLNMLVHLVTVFWMDAAPEFLVRRQTLLRIESKNPEHFLGPVMPLCSDRAPRPTSGVGQPLGFGEISFTLPERLLRTVAFNGDAHHLRPKLDQSEILRVRSSRFAIVHAEGAQDFSFPRKNWTRPGGSQPVLEGRSAVLRRLPQRVGRDVRDYDRGSPIGRRTARAGARSDWKSFHLLSPRRS